MAFDPGQDRASVEAFYTARRLTELRLRPVTGDFDTAHLREINRRIFQDMPGLGFNDVTPGSFRPPAPRGQDWIKIDGSIQCLSRHTLPTPQWILALSIHSTP